MRKFGIEKRKRAEKMLGELIRQQLLGLVRMQLYLNLGMTMKFKQPEGSPETLGYTNQITH